MSDLLFLGSEDLAGIVAQIGAFVGFGIGLAMVVWLFGYVIYWIIDVLRGGI